MRPPRSSAARRALALWRPSPLSARLHTRIRWWTAPFEELETCIPRIGNILELGCGHGLFTTFMSLSSAGRDVVGIDIDAEKIALAQQMAGRLRPGEAHVSFSCHPSGDIPVIENGWDAIVIADVLYLLGADARELLITECVDALASGGRLVVKEVDTEPRVKARFAQFQELLATKVFHITDGATLDFPSAADLEASMRTRGLATSLLRLDKGYFHPHCAVVGTKPAQ